MVQVVDPTTLIHKGSVKDVYKLSKDEILFKFSDRISVFDKIIPSEVPHKGETLCRTSVHWFNQLEDMGIPTHFKEYIPPASMKTKEVRIVYDYSKLNKESTNYLIPLEFIARYYVAGSLFDRLNKGKMSPEDAGFSPDHEVKYGEKLPEPFYEVSTKLEQVDRMLDYDEAL
ncbi:MAG: phosphoribosylaminoimidazolesuccinocarboxamide synthase, partial [Methermicoccaceae archaeon]